MRQAQAIYQNFIRFLEFYERSRTDKVLNKPIFYTV